MAGDFSRHVVAVSRLMGLEMAVHDALHMMIGFASMGVGRGKPPSKRQDWRDDERSGDSLNCQQDAAIIGSGGQTGQMN